MTALRLNLPKKLNEVPTGLGVVSPPLANARQPIAIVESDGPAVTLRGGPGNVDEANRLISEEDALQARLDNLRRN